MWLVGTPRVPGAATKKMNLEVGRRRFGRQPEEEEKVVKKVVDVES
jgi:hypothetical protein